MREYPVDIQIEMFRQFDLNLEFRVKVHTKDIDMGVVNV